MLLPAAERATPAPAGPFLPAGPAPVVTGARFSISSSESTPVASPAGERAQENAIAWPSGETAAEPPLPTAGAASPPAGTSDPPEAFALRATPGAPPASLASAFEVPFAERSDRGTLVVDAALTEELQWLLDRFAAEGEGDEPPDDSAEGHDAPTADAIVRLDDARVSMAVEMSAVSIEIAPADASRVGPTVPAEGSSSSRESPGVSEADTVDVANRSSGDAVADGTQTRLEQVAASREIIAGVESAASVVATDGPHGTASGRPGSPAVANPDAGPIWPLEEDAARPDSSGTPIADQVARPAEAVDTVRPDSLRDHPGETHSNDGSLKRTAGRSRAERDAGAIEPSDVGNEASDSVARDADGPQRTPRANRPAGTPETVTVAVVGSMQALATSDAISAAVAPGPMTPSRQDADGIVLAPVPLANGADARTSEPIAVPPGERLSAQDAARFADRLAEAITLSRHADGRLRVRLHPPELGTIQIDVRLHDGELTARLDVQSASAHLALSETLPALRDSLAQLRAPVDRVDLRLVEPRRPEGDSLAFEDGLPDRGERHQRDAEGRRRRPEDEGRSTGREDETTGEGPDVARPRAGMLGRIDVNL